MIPCNYNQIEIKGRGYLHFHNAIPIFLFNSYSIQFEKKSKNLNNILRNSIIQNCYFGFRWRSPGMKWHCILYAVLRDHHRNWSFHTKAQWNKINEMKKN